MLSRSERKGYFGVEQEIFINKKDLSKSGGYKPTEEERLFKFVKRIEPGFKASEDKTRIWLPQGLFYVDSDAPEISTYPVPIQEGCIEELIQNIAQSRAFMVDLGHATYQNKALVKGWSMHYNFSSRNKFSGADPSRHIHEMLPILTYFLSHPWSHSPNMITTSLFSPPRLHLGTEFMQDYDPIRAAMGFFLAHVFGEKKVSLGLDIADIGEKKHYILTNGRETSLKLKTGTVISLQYHLTKAYEVLHEDIERFGGTTTTKIIEEYITGKKKTSIDLRKDEELAGEEEDWVDYNAHPELYLLTATTDQNMTQPTIVTKIRELLEKNIIEDIDWNGVKFKGRENLQKIISLI